MATKLDKKYILLLLSIIIVGKLFARSNDTIVSVLTSGSWRIEKIIDNGTTFYLPTDDKNAYIVNFNYKKKRKDGFYGRIRVNTKNTDINSNYFCNIKKEIYFILDKQNPSVYTLHWSYYNGYNNKIHTNIYGEAFKSIFNSSGYIEIKGNILLFKGKESQMYLIKVH
jgi:hypothetical protein